VKESRTDPFKILFPDWLVESAHAMPIFLLANGCAGC
jgi:hypothetical protein